MSKKWHRKIFIYEKYKKLMINMTLSVIEKDRLLSHAQQVVIELLKSTRSKKISIKLRTLLRYAYISYIRKTFDLNMLRGLVPRIKPPYRYTNQYVYRDLENMLRKNFNVILEKRRQYTYATFYKKL